MARRCLRRSAYLRAALCSLHLILNSPVGWLHFISLRLRRDYYFSFQLLARDDGISIERTDRQVEHSAQQLKTQPACPSKLPASSQRESNEHYLEIRYLEIQICSLDTSFEPTVQKNLCPSLSSRRIQFGPSCATCSFQKHGPLITPASTIFFKFAVNAFHFP